MLVTVIELSSVHIVLSERVLKYTFSTDAFYLVYKSGRTVRRTSDGEQMLDVMEIKSEARLR